MCYAMMLCSAPLPGLLFEKDRPMSGSGWLFACCFCCWFVLLSAAVSLVEGSRLRVVFAAGCQAFVVVRP